MTSHRSLFHGETITQALSVYLPATALCRLIGLVRNILLTWWMFDPTEFGLFALALVVINLLNPLCSLALNEAVTRYTPLYETRGMLRGFVWRSGLLVCVVGAATTALLLKLAPTVGGTLFETLTLRTRSAPAHAMSSHVLMENIAWTTFTLIVYFFAIGVFKGLRMFRAISLMELVSASCFTVLALMAVLRGHGTAAAVIACYMMSMWVALACFALPAALIVFTSEPDDRGRPARS